MNSSPTYEEALSWITQQTRESGSCKYGRNRRSIEEGIREQTARATTIRNNEHKVKSVIDKTRDPNKKSVLDKAFLNLKDVVRRKQDCLQTMLSVATLEENCSRLSREIDEHTVGLVRTENKNVHHVTDPHLPGFIASAAQDCVSGLQDNWEWISELVRCIDRHQKNGADYHQFFHEVAESEPWMVDDLRKVSERFVSPEIESTGSERDSKLLAAELDVSIILDMETYISLRQWESKTNKLWESATRLVPVPLRTTRNTAPIPARMLCSYETNEISVRRDEDILLLDNTKPHSWKIRNGRGVESEVPSLTVLIPGPDQGAIETAVNVRLRLLGEWTNALKRIGKRLICFMLQVFKPEYNTHEIESLKSVKDMDKEQMLQVISFIEDGLKKNWSGHKGFISLQERILALRMVLEESGSDSSLTGGARVQSLITQITSLGEIIKVYQDMSKNWELYKVSVETSRAPELMLIVDKWEQLQFVTREFFSKFWKTKLPLDESERKLMLRQDFKLEGIEYEDSIEPCSPQSLRLNQHTPTHNGWGGRGFVQTSTNRVQTTEEFYTQEALQHSRPEAYATVQDEGYQSPRYGGEGATTSIRIESRYLEAPRDFARALEKLHKQAGARQGEGRVETIIKLEVNRTEERRDDEGSSGGGMFETTPKRVDKVNNGSGSREMYETTVRRQEVSNDHGSFGKLSVVDDRSNGYEGSSDSGMYETVIKKEIKTNRLRDEDSSDSGMFEIVKKTETTNNRRAVQQPVVQDTYTEEEGFEELQEFNYSTGRYETVRQVETRSNGMEETVQKAEPVKARRAVQRTQMQDLHMDEEGFEELKEVNFGIRGIKKQEHEGTDFGVATIRKTATSEQLCSAEVEEKKTFYIRGVVSPEDGGEISLEQAILSGVVRPKDGTYYNSETRQSLPLSCAMSDGLIKVSYTTTRRSPEKTSTIGIITVKTIREIARPYTILSVRDTRRNGDVSQEEAVRRGLVDEKAGTYRDPRTSKTMLITEAAEAGLIKLEYEQQNGQNYEPEVVSKTYAVRAVVDRRSRKTITFQDAMRAGIIDRDSGAYRDNLTGETMYVGDAIMRGFLKARQLEHEDIIHGLNIDPENKMVVDKEEKIRKCILRPLSVISAFKRAAQQGKK